MKAPVGSRTGSRVVVIGGSGCTRGADSSRSEVPCSFAAHLISHILSVLEMDATAYLHVLVILDLFFELLDVAFFTLSKGPLRDRQHCALVR